MKRQILVCLFMLASMFTVAQIRVTGMVNDKSGEGLAGVTVLVKGAPNTYSITDAEGKYAITVSQDAILEFSYIGMHTVEKKVDNRSVIDVEMQNEFTLDEVVVISYGTMRKSDLTGSVGTIKSATIENVVSSQGPLASMQGQIAGVSIESVSGEPGESMNIRIRGVSSFTNSNPLYVIDGLVGGGLNTLNPNDIESIEILKDASSCAIYGAAGGNGVVLVTTKSGKLGKRPSIEVRANVGMNWLKTLDVLDATDYCRFVNERTVTNSILPEGAGTIVPLPNASPIVWAASGYDTGKGTDWQDEVFDVGVIQDYAIAASGGDSHTKYRIGGGYTNERGALRHSSSNKVTINSRIDINSNKWKYGLGVNYFHQNRDYSLWGGSTGSKNAVFNAAMFNPMVSTTGEFYESDVPYWLDETLSADQADQIANAVPPTWRLDQMRGYSSKNYVNANFYLEFLPIKELSIKTQASYGYVGQESDSFYPSYYFSPRNSKTYNEAMKSTSNGNHVNWDLFATFNKGFKGHNLKVMTAMNMSLNRQQRLDNKGLNTPSNDIKVITSVTENINITGNRSEIVAMSFFSRFNYDYKNRYLFQATFRKDGTSRFAKENKWGNFPSFGAAWKLSEEPFMENAKEVLSLAKFHVSWGQLGNSNINPYQYTNYVVSGLNYTIGSNQRKWSGINVLDFATPDVGWEISDQIDCGVDLSFFDNKLTFEYSYFNKITKNLLIRFPVPAESGGYFPRRNPWKNIGKIANWGHELNVHYNQMFGDFGLQVNFNASHIKNKVLSMGETTNAIYGGVLYSGAANSTVFREGDPIGSFFIVKTDGLFNNQEEIDNYTWQNPDTGETSLIQPLAKPGDIKFIDYNNDGRIDGNDRQILGSPFPVLAGGFGATFSYKSLSLEMFFIYSIGNQIMNSALYTLTPAPNNNMMNVLQEYWDNHWTSAHPERDDVRFPRNIQMDGNVNSMMSDRYLSDGSYLRFKTLKLSYGFARKTLEKIGINNMQMFVTGQNLFVLTRYDGYDPDVGGKNLLNRGVDTGEGMPIARSALIGFSINF